MSNPSLTKSLRLLTHPLSLASLVLLLVNDHLLRKLWPSWFTGKLGDLAWLFFAPLALAVVVSLVLPRRWQQRTQPTAVIAFGITGALFALAKTAPAVHEMVLAAGALVGFPLGLRRDPTDLLALVAWGASALLWRRTMAPPPAPKTVAAGTHGAGWVALGVAALLTAANSPAPEPGIFCVAAAEDRVYAFAGYSSFESADGGLTWTGTQQQQFDCGSPWGAVSGSEVLEPGGGGAIRYRFAPGKPVEISDDGGQTWRLGYTAEPLTEAEQAMAQRRLGNAASIRATPLDGVIDRVTGNAIFAMGHSGVLVHEAGGGWRAVHVNGFRASQALTGSDMVDLLLGEGLLALGTLVLAFVTLVTVADRGRRGWMIFLLALAWLVWLGIILLLGPARLSGYGAMIGYMALLSWGVLLALALIAAVVKLARGLRGVAWRAVLVAAGAALLFLLPYVFWATDALPSYQLAAGFAAALAVAVTVGGSRVARAGAKPPSPAAG